MKFRIVEKETFNFVGVSKLVPLQFEGVNNAIVEYKSKTEREDVQSTEY